MKWFEYNQNNSGGKFMVNDKVCHRLFIEAKSKNLANAIAFDLGVYFDGVSDGRDCDCCGDRWGDPWEKLDDLKAKSIVEYAQDLADNYGWTTPDARIYYADNRIVEIFTQKKVK